MSCGIMGDRKTNLVIVNGNLSAFEYINQVLRRVAVPFIHQHAPATLMHDNARLTRQYLNANSVAVFGWPVVSPDLLGRRVRPTYVVNNVQDLTNAPTTFLHVVCSVTSIP